MNPLLRTILSSAWAIDEAYAISVNEMMQRMFAGEPVNLNTLVSMKSEALMISDLNSGKDVAVIRIHDVIMREDWCGVLGTESINNLLKSYASNPSIGGVLLDFDTPGGQVAYTENLANTINDFPKPIFAYISSSCASAGYWLASQCDAIYTSVNTDRVGSIGTMISYYKDNPDSPDKPRYVQVNVYSSKSTRKNRSIENMLAGNHEDVITKMLDPINDVFINQVTTARPQIDEKALSGEMYYSYDAIKLGLIDGMKSMEEVISLLSQEIQNAQNQSMGIFSKHKKPVQMKNEVFSNILGRDVMEGEVLSVEDLATVQNHIVSLQSAPPAPVTQVVEAPVAIENPAPSIEEAIASALAPISSQIEAFGQRIAKLEGPGATVTEPKPVSGAAFDGPSFMDPNNEVNKQAAKDLGL
jgi:ClpP class serine protease